MQSFRSLQSRLGDKRFPQGYGTSGRKDVDMDDYVDAVISAFQDEDGNAFAALLSLSDSHASDLLSSSLCTSETENSPEPSELSRLSGTLNSDYQNLVALHTKCIFAISRDDLLGAFCYQEDMAKQVSGVLPKLQNEDVSWFLPSLNTIARDLSALALKVDQIEHQSNDDQAPPAIDRAFNGIQHIVRTCAAEKGASEEHSKKRALVPLVNQLFRLCFRTGRANLCKPLVRTIENLKILDRCPASQVVSYYYFAGKLAVVEGDYILAEQKLTVAYEKCSNQFSSNMKAILRMLIPLRLRLDIRPSDELLKRNDLYQYHDVIHALERADIVGFHQAMNRHERDFIKWSVYYLIDNLRLIMFRHVFKKLCDALNYHIIPIEDFTAVLGAAGYRTATKEDPTDADAECIIVNLIGEEMVKAYVSWQLKKIVVAKTGAFPSLKKSLKS